MTSQETISKSTLEPALLRIITLLTLFTVATPRGNGAVREAWAHFYDGPASKSDVARAVGADRLGNIIVTGTSSNSTNDIGHMPNYLDIYTAKYAAKDGTLIWEQRYNGPADDFDAPVDLAVDTRGNAIVAGVSVSGGVSSIHVAKYASADGTLLWEQNIGEAEVRAVKVDRHGNVFVAGYAERRIPSYLRTGYLAKLARSNGALLWEQRTSPGQFEDIEIDPRGNVFVAGNATGLGLNSDFVTAKHAGKDGHLLWEKHQLNGQATALALDQRGGVISVGSTYGSHADQSFYTVKYSGSDGSLLWERSYHDPRGELDIATAVAIDRKGNVFVAGNVESQGDESDDKDLYMAKYSGKSGDLLWEHTHDDPINGNDLLGAMVVDRNGNVVVAGTTAGIRYDSDSFIYDIYTAQYDSRNGAVRWEQLYDSEGHGDDRQGGRHSLALGPNGMVVVTGYTGALTSTPDFATIVYRDNGLHPSKKAK